MEELCCKKMILKKISHTRKNVKSISTVITIILGIVVMVLTINPPDIIFVLNMFAFGGLECTFFWPLVGGLFWKKRNKAGGSL